MTELATRPVYGVRTTKRATRTEMELRRESLFDIAREVQPAGVRHIYYRAVVAGLVPKTQQGYRKVQRELLELRRGGRLPFSWIVDEGRKAHWPLVDRSPYSALRSLALTYQRDPWQDPGLPRVEVWVESQSIAGMLDPLLKQFAVPIFPLRGQGSESFVWSAAREYSAHQPVVVLYSGDYDPAGLQIGSQLEGKLRAYADPHVSIDFRHVMVTEEQAEMLQALGTEPKQRHWVDYDGNRHPFRGRAVEGEAVDPRTMRDLLAAIIRDIAVAAAGYDIFEASAHTEREEQRALWDALAAFGGERDE